MQKKLHKLSQHIQSQISIKPPAVRYINVNEKEEITEIENENERKKKIPSIEKIKQKKKTNSRVYQSANKINNMKPQT